MIAEKHKIASPIQHLKVSVDHLTHLSGNPRLSEIDKIAASYEEFGQLKPITCNQEESGEIVVLSGNHQLMAARDVLGWTHIAAVIHEELPPEKALAFALTENHWGNIGSIDQELQFAALQETVDDFTEFYEMIGWDDFSMATMESRIIESELQVEHDSNAGWEPPKLIEDSPTIPKDATPEEAARPFTPTADTDTIVTQGSTATSKSGSRHAVIQYTLVFDNSEQQQTWYSFVKWLSEQEVYEGNSTAERLTAYLKSESLG